MSDGDRIGRLEEGVKFLLTGDHIAVCFGEKADCKGLSGLLEEGNSLGRRAL